MGSGSGLGCVVGKNQDHIRILTAARGGREGGTHWRETRASSVGDGG